jgi:LysM repeat protein
VFCVLAVGIASLTAMLIQGCKREQTETTENNAPVVDTNLPPTIETNLPQVEASNPPVQLPPAVVPPAVTEAAAAEYVVVKGDTLAKIAKKNGVTLKALKTANPGVEPAKLKVGQKLSVPASTTAAPAVSTGASGGEGIYTVKSGDTLTKVAKAHGTTVKAIESENNLTTTKIKVGQKLKIPAKAEALPPATPVSSVPAMPPQGATPAPASAPSGQ